MSARNVGPGARDLGPRPRGFRFPAVSCRFPDTMRRRGVSVLKVGTADYLDEQQYTRASIEAYELVRAKDFSGEYRDQALEQIVHAWTQASEGAAAPCPTPRA